MLTLTNPIKKKETMFNLSGANYITKRYKLL